MPQNRPSSVARRAAMAMASSLDTCDSNSMTTVSTTIRVALQTVLDNLRHGPQLGRHSSQG
jgi:hypothetical protein